MPKGHTNNHNGRPTKGKETRKAVTFRLQPSTIERVKYLALCYDISQSDVIEGLVDEKTRAAT